MSPDQQLGQLLLLSSRAINLFLLGLGDMTSKQYHNHLSFFVHCENSGL